MKFGKRARGLARRYGHSAMSTVHNVTADIRKLANDNPLGTAALVGGLGGAITAGLSVPAAAVVGLVSGVAIEQATHKR